MDNNLFGIYEKALPKGSWEQKFQVARDLGFDFIEMSIDESDNRLARLDWSNAIIRQMNAWQQQYEMPIRSICFSGQRRYPMGSVDANIRVKSMALLEQCFMLAQKLNCHIIQLAGYDVYYEPKSKETNTYFLVNLNKALAWANKYSVILSVETMDDKYCKNADDFFRLKEATHSPWFAVYPDLGNLSAWVQGDANNVIAQLHKMLPYITGVHIKDTLAVSKTSKGVFKKVPFGEGCVPFVELFTSLKKMCYQGSFLIEAWFEDDKETIAELKKALAFVKKAMHKGGWTC